jgi:outer membrane immunogenic protein
MKRSLFGIALIAALGGTPALAADLQCCNKAPPPPCCASPAYSWSGFYIGADVGAAWATDTVSPLVADGGTFPRSNTLNTSGVLGGGTAGYNYQFSSILVGVEGDIGYMAIAGFKADALGGTEVDNLNSGLYGDATGRAGVIFGNALLYGKGGWAFFNGRANTTTSLPGFTVGNTGTFSGWTAGGGLEYKLSPAWSAKAEYMYYKFGTQDATLTSGAGVFPYANALTVNSVKMGLNYQFNWAAPAPCCVTK